MMPFPIGRAALAAALLWPCVVLAAGAPATRDPEADTTNGVAALRPGQAPASGKPDAAQTTEIQRYCQNIAAAAAEARNAWQAKKLGDLQAQVTKSMADLEAREAEFKDVLARRDDALKRADAALVGIFAKMKPDAAAAQLSALDDDIASALLQQLNPRAASAILGEIAPERAVRLVNTMAGVTPADGKKS